MRRLRSGVRSTHCHSHFQGCGICSPYTSPGVQNLTLLGQDFFSFLDGHKLFVCDMRK